MSTDYAPYITPALPILLGMTLTCGCVHKQFVREPYPRWGEEILLKRKDNPVSLTMRLIMPSEQAQGCLLIVHGMNEYIGRYGEIAGHFARRFIVAGFDLYGHGLSNPFLQQADRALAIGSKEHDVSKAYLCQVPLRNLDPMRQDLGIVMHKLATLCDEQGAAGKPVFILSHSLGSLVAASWLLQARDNEDVKRVKGIVFIGPAFSVTHLPGWRGWLANPFIRLSFFAEEHFLQSNGEPLPLLKLNQAVALPTASIFNALFEILSWPGLRQLFTPVTPDWVVDYLTDWEEEKARHRADGYIIRRSLLRYVKGVEKEIAGFRRRMSEFVTPYFLVYSGRDPITPAWGSQDFARVTLDKHPDNRLLPLPDLNLHEHLFSAPPKRKEILRQIDLWLDRRLSSIKRQGEFPP